MNEFRKLTNLLESIEEELVNEANPSNIKLWAEVRKAMKWSEVEKNWGDLYKDLAKIMRVYSPHAPTESVNEEVTEGGFEAKINHTPEGPKITITQSGHPIAIMHHDDWEDLNYQIEQMLNNPDGIGKRQS